MEDIKPLVATEGKAMVYFSNEGAIEGGIDIHVDKDTYEEVKAMYPEANIEKGSENFEMLEFDNIPLGGLRVVRNR